ncbi:MAG: bifunctional riboflavin kinase/FAD synthetase [Cryomorphaceae bacterium]|nr:bifunctional riboflavin kinase/FAD synthetase [Cryomorphaceae bacterium]
MKVYHSIEEFTRVNNVVLTTGTFDGVHFGHRTILNRLIRIAKECQGESVLLTFNPHPRIVLQPSSNIKLLCTLEEKIELLQKTGLDHLIIHPFTKSFSQTDSETFIQQLLVDKIGAKKLVIGYDHHFGKNREGSFENLKKSASTYGFSVEEIPAQELDDVTVSSTKIRQALIEGKVDKAEEWLGYHYRIRGKVVQGKQIGRSISFPTANIVVSDLNKLIPGNGVFAVRVKRLHQPENQLLLGMCNIGNKPTIGEGFRTIEVHLFDFNESIYGEELEVSFIKTLRHEEKFDNLDALKGQLEKDKTQALSVLKNL